MALGILIILPAARELLYLGQPPLHGVLLPAGGEGHVGVAHEGVLQPTLGGDFTGTVNFYGNLHLRFFYIPNIGHHQQVAHKQLNLRGPVAVQQTNSE